MRWFHNLPLAVKIQAPVAIMIAALIVTLAAHILDAAYWAIMGRLGFIVLVVVVASAACSLG
jgi:hypothetical protein